MNKDQFMNAVGKEAEAILPELSKECIDYVVIHANFIVRDGFWKYYNTENEVKTIVKMLVDNFLKITGNKEKK